MLSGAGGCAAPGRMQLVGPVAQDWNDLIWWSVGAADSAVAPVIGVEIRGAAAQTERWLLTDHGVRCYRYRGTQLIGVGPPLPTGATPEEFAETRNWLGDYLPHVVPQRTLPAAPVAGLTSMADILALLHTQWADRKVDPPAPWTARELTHEGEEFRHGIAELLAAAATLGG
jgi:hypothetical protein